MTDRDNILSRYCRMSRRLMLPFVTPNSCIASTKVTCDCLQRFGFNVRPLPTKLVFMLPDRNLAFSSGLSDAELATARDSRKVFGDGWNGHLVALVDESWLVDASLDQVNDAIPDIALPKEAFLFPVRGANVDTGFHAKYSVVLDDGQKATINYLTTTNETFRETEAWNDEGLDFIAEHIRERIGGR